MASTPSPKKLVLITGATGGIGRATALAFAKTGFYDLALHYNSASASDRTALQQEIDSASPPETSTQTLFFQADLSSYASVRSLHASVLSSFSPHHTGISILFNNAGSTSGISGVTDLSNVPIDVFEQTWRLNTASGILLSQLCLPYMQTQKFGRIIFNSSIAAFTGGLVGPHYASSKSAIHGFVHWVGANAGKDGVTCNAVAPAVVKETKMLDVAGDEERERELSARLPVGRLGMPEEVAGTVMWMVQTGYVTRKIVIVDGGMHPY